MQEKPLYDSAVFWVAFATALLAVGGILTAIGIAQVGAGPKASLWGNAWFVIGVSIIAVGVGLLAYALYLFVRHHRPPTKTALRTRAPTTTPISTDPTNALKVSWEAEEWSNFRHEARFLRLKVRIENVSDSPISFNGASLRDGPSFAHGLNREVWQEGDRLRHGFPAPRSNVPPHDSVDGWYVYDLAYDSGMGEPEYEFRIHSSKGGHEYGFRRAGNPKLPMEVPPPAPAPLQARHEQREPYAMARFAGRPPDVHAVGIYNPVRNPVATHVRVEIVGMDPLPRNVRDRPPTFRRLFR